MIDTEQGLKEDCQSSETENEIYSPTNMDFDMEELIQNHIE